MPPETATMRSLHLPRLRHEVGTGMPRSSAQSKSEAPCAACIDCPLMASVTISAAILRIRRLRGEAQKQIHGGGSVGAVPVRADLGGKRLADEIGRAHV